MLLSSLYTRRPVAVDFFYAAARRGLHYEISADLYSRELTEPDIDGHAKAERHH